MRNHRDTLFSVHYVAQQMSFVAAPTMASVALLRCVLQAIAARPATTCFASLTRCPVLRLAVHISPRIGSCSPHCRRPSWTSSCASCALPPEPHSVCCVPFERLTSRSDNGSGVVTASLLPPEHRIPRQRSGSFAGSTALDPACCSSWLLVVRSVSSLVFAWQAVQVPVTVDHLLRRSRLRPLLVLNWPARRSRCRHHRRCHQVLRHHHRCPLCRRHRRRRRRRRLPSATGKREFLQLASQLASISIDSTWMVCGCAVKTFHSVKMSMVYCTTYWLLLSLIHSSPTSRLLRQLFCRQLHRCPVERGRSLLMSTMLIF
mmetsp:Transcript_33812/g.84860  ORF Transcript_33812/g.84860 Transcript_33812/m.84860 type:complete len:317 (-) Transcript_33812:2795-3745(-)